MATYTQKDIMQAVIEQSARNQIPANLVGAVVLKESSWRSPAINGDGGRSIGSMQVQVATAKGVAEQRSDLMGVHPSVINEEWLSDVNNNIKAGTAVLKYHADKENLDINSSNDQKKILALYNSDGTPAGISKSYANGYPDSVINNKAVVQDSIDKYKDNPSAEFTAPVGSAAPSSGIAGGGAGNSGAAGNRLPSVGTDASTWNFSIMNFARFVATKTFYAYMQKTYEQTLEMSLHGFLATFMKKFYHYVQYIPTLPNCLAIVVKPETPFMDIPSCNVIYPTLKGNINFTRNYLAEPTRLLVTSDPIRGLFQNSIGTPGIINTLVFMDYEGTTKKETVVGLNVLKSLNGTAGEGNDKKPLTNCSAFEMENGIRIQRLLGGDDFYLYMIGDPGSRTSKEKNANLLKLDEPRIKEASKTLENLAKYHLLKLRYDARPGSTTTFFNPYIVPGFPMVSIEGTHDSNLNVTAYVTNISHNLSPSGSTTTVSFNATHIATDPPPNCMPIIEVEYENGAAEVYKNMFGSAVTAIGKATGIQTVKDKYKEQKGTVSETLKTIWRPLTTAEEYMSVLAHGATIDEDGKFAVMKSGFFKTETQELLKAYSKQILEDQQAFYETDVR